MCIFSHTATVETIEIASDSDSVGATGMTISHNITGDFIQSGVNITVSVEAINSDMLYDPVFLSVVVNGGESSYTLVFTSMVATYIEVSCCMYIL